MLICVDFLSSLYGHLLGVLCVLCVMFCLFICQLLFTCSSVCVLQGSGAGAGDEGDMEEAVGRESEHSRPLSSTVSPGPCPNTPQSPLGPSSPEQTGDEEEGGSGDRPSRSQPKSKGKGKDKRKRRAPLHLTDEQEVAVAGWLEDPDQECLYNKGLKMYRDSAKKNRLWAVKAKELNVDRKSICILFLICPTYCHICKLSILAPNART